MPAKQNVIGSKAPDGSDYVTLTDGAGNLLPASGTGATVIAAGDVASGAADSGNPVKIAGTYNATKPTFADGQRGTVQIGTRGAVTIQSVLPDSASAVTTQAVGADTVSNTYNAYLGASLPLVFNNASWDRQRSAINATNSTGTGIVAAGLVAQLDDVSPTAITENQFGNVRMGVERGLYTSGMASTVGGATYLNIAAGQATTVVKATAGTLYSIVLNSAATATNTTVVYDHPSGVGTVIGRPAVTTATVPTTLTFGPAGIAFANGLTIITAVANGGDMTVCYK